MIILDTNVVSAMMRLHQDPAIAAWLEQQSRAELYICTPTVFEIRLGIDDIPLGKRRTAIDKAFANVMTVMLQHDAVSLDNSSANAAGSIYASRKKRGDPPEAVDCLIAGIALMQGARIATRNIKDFANLDIEIINPWASR